MALHIVPIISILICTHMIAYNAAYFKFVKDQMYGGEQMLPAFLLIAFNILYYSIYYFFKFVVGF